MRKLLPATALVTLLSTATPVYADDAAPAAPAVIEAGSGSGSGSSSSSTSVTTTPTSTTTETTVTTTSTSTTTTQEQLEAVIKAFAAYKAENDATSKRLLLFALITTITNLLISVLKWGTGLGTKAKKWIPVFALALGVVVGLFSNLAAGTSLATAVLYGAGPPLAVFVHELLNLVRKSPPAPSPT